MARAATELVAHFPMPASFKDVMDQVAAEFTRANPDVTVRFPAPSPTYEDGLQQVIRQAAAGGLADLSLQGLNRLRFDGGVQRLLPRGSWQLAGGQEVRGMEQLHPVALAAACDDAGQVIDQGGDALLLAHPCLPGAVGRAEPRLHAAQHAGNAGP